MNQSNPDLSPGLMNQSNSVRHSNTKQVTSTTKKFVSSSSKKVSCILLFLIYEHELHYQNLNEQLETLHLAPRQFCPLPGYC